MSLYEVLGVAKNSTQKEIKQAYRKRAQETHPDREGGCEDEFHKVQQAYEVLSKPSKREQYDETGEFDTGPDNIESMAAALIITTFRQKLMESDMRFADYAEKVTVHIKNSTRKLKRELSEIERGVEKAENLINQLECSDDENLMLGVLEGVAASWRKGFQDTKMNIQVGEAAIERLELYGFKDIEANQMIEGLDSRASLKSLIGDALL